MQFDRDKSFGYPVLRPVFEDEKIKNMDFPRAQFEPVFDLKRSVGNPNVAELEYEFTVSVPEMEDDIRSQKLSIKVDIRCGRTFFAKQYDDITLKLCQENDEVEKYLMTYQNFLARIPKWNPNIVEEETKRIVEKSNCGYLNDLISCVHIIQLKSLTCMRVGNQQKKIDMIQSSVLAKN